MNSIWTLEEAKNGFDSLVDNAVHHREQVIQLKNRQQVAVVPFEDYIRQKQNRRPLGRWLLENMADIGELTLADRNEPEREIPFQ